MLHTIFSNLLRFDASIKYLGENFDLKYLRTKGKREVDFCLSNANEIIEIIEAKTKELFL